MADGACIARAGLVRTGIGAVICILATIVGCTLSGSLAMASILPSSWAAKLREGAAAGTCAGAVGSSGDTAYNARNETQGSFHIPSHDSTEQPQGNSSAM